MIGNHLYKLELLLIFLIFQKSFLILIFYPKVLKKYMNEQLVMNNETDEDITDNETTDNETTDNESNGDEMIEDMKED